MDQAEFELKNGRGFVTSDYFWLVINDLKNKSAGLITSDDVSNESSVTGASVTDALNWLLANMGGAKTHIDTVPPTVNNDSSEGYSVFSRWLDNSDPSDPTMWECTDSTVGAAIWNSIAYINQVHP